jgi:hypothetical protein
MKRKRHSRTRRTTTKSVLRLPDLEHAENAVLNTLTSPDAQRGYRHAIDEFVDWYCSEPRLAFNRIVVLRYRSHLRIPPARTRHNQSASWRRAPIGIRSCRLRLTQCRSGCWHSPSKGRQEVGCSFRKLAHRRARPCALAGARPSAIKGKTRPRLAATPARVWIKTARGRNFEIGSSSAARGALGNCRSRG